MCGDDPLPSDTILRSLLAQVPCTQPHPTQLPDNVKVTCTSGEALLGGIMEPFGETFNFTVDCPGVPGPAGYTYGPDVEDYTFVDS